VVSTKPYQDQRRDLVILAITSQIRPPLGFGEFIVADWKSAGLLKPSVVKPVFATIEKRLVIRALGQITDPDRQALATVLRTVFGA
jgi:mRNA interferase MazF